MAGWELYSALPLTGSQVRILTVSLESMGRHFTDNERLKHLLAGRVNLSTTVQTFEKHLQKAPHLHLLGLSSSLFTLRISTCNSQSRTQT